MVSFVCSIDVIDVFFSDEQAKKRTFGRVTNARKNNMDARLRGGLDVCIVCDGGGCISRHGEGVLRHNQKGYLYDLQVLAVREVETILSLCIRLIGLQINFAWNRVMACVVKHCLSVESGRVGIGEFLLEGWRSNRLHAAFVPVRLAVGQLGHTDEDFRGL